MKSSGGHEARASGAASGRAPRRRRRGPLVEVDDRLVVEDELVALDRLPQVGLELEPLDDRGAHLRLEELVAAEPGGLRAVHRDVGVAEQVLAAARRRTAIPMLALDEHLRARRSRTALGAPSQIRSASRAASLRSASVLEQDGELVAAQPGGRVARRGRTRAAARRPRRAARRRPRGRGCR